MLRSIFQKQLHQLRRLVGALAMAEEPSHPPPTKLRKIERQFDFKQYAKRHVLLMVSYLGWDYYGLVAQLDVEPTVESALYEALIKTKLVESIPTANFHRCGRTDKGVSAFRQVVSLDVRSIASEGEGVFLPDGHALASNKKDGEPELNYVAMLNRALPSDIRVLAWAPVPVGFSARYGCVQRTYKYFFPKADLDVEAMRAAGRLLIGAHDFRNFCKIDAAKNVVKDTTKTIVDTSIDQADGQQSGTDPYDMYVLTISANSFLWHQIRNIVTVLLLVGQGKEQPTVVSRLLDINACPKKPQYSPALETPLILNDCRFENVNWRWDKDARRLVISKMQGEWTKFAVKAQMIKSMCDDLSREAVQEDPMFEVVRDQTDAITFSNRRRKYVELMKRKTALDSLEEKRAKAEVKRAKKDLESGRTPTSDVSE